MHALRLEWMKFRKQKAFRVILLLYAAAMPSLMLLARLLNRLPREELPSFLPGPEALIGFPHIWEWLAYEGNWLSFFALGFLGILMITTEFRNRTIRQNVLSGMHRNQWLGNKLAFMLALAGAATLWYTCSALLIGWFHTEKVYWNTLWKNSEQAWHFLLLNMGYLSFALLLGVWIKRTGLALFLYFAWALFLESAVRWGLHFYHFQHRSFLFYPINVFEDLAPPPYAHLAESFASSFAEEYGFALYLSPREAVLAASLWIALFVALAWWRLRKMDL